MLTHTYHANWHPLTFLSHAIDIHFFGFNAAAHHWVNIAWHIACACLIYFYCPLLLNELLTHKDSKNPQLHQQISSVAAILFALHPQHVESVAWVAERKDLLCGFFYLLTLFFYHHYIKQISVCSYIACVISATLSIMAKPMAVSLPLVLILFDFLLYQRVIFTASYLKQWLHICIEKIPFVLLSLISVILTLEAQTKAEAINSTNPTSISHRLATSITNWVNYISTTLMPVNLSPFYPLENQLQWLTITICTIVIIIVFMLAEYYRRKGVRWLLLGLLYYSITILPVIGIIQIGAIKAADRYAYIPTLPVYIIFAAILIFSIKASKRKLLKSLLLIVLLLIPVLLATHTHRYTKVWKNDISLWKYVLVQNPDNINANIYLAESYYDTGNYAAAFPLYRRVFAKRELINPKHIINKFIPRFAESAYQLGLYKEAENILYFSLIEKRLLSLTLAEIYFHAALLNTKMNNYEIALQLLNMTEANDASFTEKTLLIRTQIHKQLKMLRKNKIK
jgi:hypothetical protein